MRVHVLLVTLLCLCGLGAALAEELTFSATVEDLDVKQCLAYGDGKVINPIPIEALTVGLGLQVPKDYWRYNWKTDEVNARQRHLRIAFTKPVDVGTIITNTYTGPTSRLLQPLTGRFISILKPTAAYPGDVTKDDQWIMLPAGELKLLPPGTKTRALRLSEFNAGDRREPWATNLGLTLLFTQRYYSALNLGYAKKTTLAKQPEVLIAAWQEPQAVAGIVFFGLNMPILQVESLKPQSTEHPNIAPTTEWKRQPDCPGGGAVSYRFDKPVPTRGLKLTGPVLNPNGSYFRTVIPLVSMGDLTEVPSLQLPPPPYKLSYNMPMDGFVAIEINEKKTGKRVRRLVAEVARQQGPIEERWDLKDDNGETVPPGEYTWKAIARPPFKNTYELTVYNAGQPAWWAPAPGKGGGGWLGDHGCPNAAAAVGNKLFLGSFCAESGNVAAATDLEGNKEWGTFAISYGFRGPDRIVSDGKNAYLVNDAVIVKVEPENSYKQKFIYNFKHTNELPGNGQDWDTVNLRGGAAARGDKLYMSFNTTPESWIKTSFPADLLDPKLSIPLIFLRKGNGHRAIKGDKVYAEGEYDELMQFYATFITNMTPEQTATYPGVGLPSSTQASYGGAPKEGPLAGTLTVAFKKPVAVGSILIPDGAIKVYALKPGAKLPAGNDEEAMVDVDLGMGNHEEDIEADNPFNEEIWTPLTTVGKAGRPAIALAPEKGLRTTALRFKADRLSYCLVMARRMEDAAPEAERVFTEGKLTPKGGWEVTRENTAPINSFNPARLGLVWPTAQTLRGVSLILPVGDQLAVDYFTGAGDPKAALADDKQWQQAGVLKTEIFMGYFGQEATVRNVDFGKLVQTRAVRVRAILPKVNRDKHTASVQAILAYRHLGADPDNLPVVLSERITEFQLPADGTDEEAKVLRQIPFAKPNNLTFDQAGTLYCVSDGQIVTVPLREGETSKVIITRDKLEQPGSITFDAEGLLYVADCGPKAIRVFDPQTGKQVRTIGKPGGQQVGKWDPERMDNPGQLAIDSAGKLWVADVSYQPKRVVRFSRDGKAEKWFLGPTQYGGGGCLDEGNRAVVNYAGMKFTIDWATREWKMDSILYRPGDPRSLRGAMPDRATYYKGKRYLVGPPPGAFVLGESDIAVVCEERNSIAVPMAAMGGLEKWQDIDERPDLQQAFGALNRSDYAFVWWDKNGDGKPQAAEVQTTKQNFSRVGVRVGEDLAFIAPGWRLKPTGFTPAGIPMYDISKIEPVTTYTHGPGARTQNVWETADGRTFLIGTRLIDKDGKSMLWEYYNEFACHGGFYTAAFGYDRPPGVLNQEHWPIGHFTLKNGQGKEEEYFVTNSDEGDWFVYTNDGMLVGCIFGGPAGYGLRQWTMPEWEPGKVDLSDVRMGQEHYQGHVCKAEDGKIYAVCGHNHVSIVRVEGLEQLQRLGGALTITADDVTKAMNWQIQRATLEKVRQEAKVAKVPYLEKGVEVNGSLDDWPDELFVNVHDYWVHSLYTHEFVVHTQAAFAYDEHNLYVAVRTLDGSPLKNAAQDPIRLFKSGDAADITLGLDPNADPKRTGPAPGDTRLLLAPLKDGPVAVAYKPVVPGATDAKRARFTSPVGSMIIDEAYVIPDADVRFKANDGNWGWIMEAAIPWKSLGVEAPKVGVKIRGDVGILQSDQNGMSTAGRLYWSGKSQTVICDVPSEARLAPSLWGELDFVDPDKGMQFGPEEVELVGP